MTPMPKPGSVYNEQPHFWEIDRILWRPVTVAVLWWFLFTGLVDVANWLGI